MKLHLHSTVYYPHINEAVAGGEKNITKQLKCNYTIRKKGMVEVPFKGPSKLVLIIH